MDYADYLYYHDGCPACNGCYNRDSATGHCKLKECVYRELYHELTITDEATDAKMHSREAFLEETDGKTFQKGAFADFKV